MATGSLTVDQIGTLTKRYAGAGATVITDVFNAPSEGILSAFPMEPKLDYQRAELWTFKGNAGQINQVVDGPGDTSNWKYVRAYRDMYTSWDKKSYDILDSVQTEIAANRLAQDGTQQVLNFFRTARVYKIINEMANKTYASNTHSTTTTGGVWGVEGQSRGEADIVKAIKGIVKVTGIDMSSGSAPEFGLIYPSSVMDELGALKLINMVVTKLSDYLSAAWKITPYPFTPFMDDAGNQYIDVKDQTSSDILGTSAYVFVKGNNTIRQFEYRPGDIMTTETARIPGTSWLNIFKQCYTALAVPHDGTENGTNKLLYKITNVTT